MRPAFIFAAAGAVSLALATPAIAIAADPLGNGGAAAVGVIAASGRPDHKTEKPKPTKTKTVEPTKTKTVEPTKTKTVEPTKTKTVEPTRTKTTPASPTASPTELPVTGTSSSDTIALAGVGLTLVGAGTVLVLARRRRDSTA